MLLLQYCDDEWDGYASMHNGYVRVGTMGLRSLGTRAGRMSMRWSWVCTSTVNQWLCTIQHRLYKHLEAVLDHVQRQERSNLNATLWQERSNVVFNHTQRVLAVVADGVGHGRMQLCVFDAL